MEDGREFRNNLKILTWMLTRSQTLCVTPTTVQKVMQRVWGQFHSVDDILMGIFQVVDCARMRQSA